MDGCRSRFITEVFWKQADRLMSTFPNGSPVGGCQERSVPAVCCSCPHRGPQRHAEDELKRTVEPVEKRQHRSTLDSKRSLPLHPHTCYAKVKTTEGNHVTRRRRRDAGHRLVR